MRNHSVHSQALGQTFPVLKTRGVAAAEVLFCIWFKKVIVFVERIFLPALVPDN